MAASPFSSTLFERLRGGKASSAHMAMSKEKKWLTDEEIQELIFLPDGELSDVDFDSDPDDPEYEPRDDRKN
ncbi:hypothetical protein MRX96_019613 [Rhipicephalus microplus]